MKKIIVLKIIVLMLVLLTLNACVGGVSPPIEDKCRNECSKFNYSYLKTDVLTSRSTNNYGCWCMDENQNPKSIGIIENEFDFMRWIITS